MSIVFDREKVLGLHQIWSTEATPLSVCELSNANRGIFWDFRRIWSVINFLIANCRKTRLGLKIHLTIHLQSAYQSTYLPIHFEGSSNFEQLSSEILIRLMFSQEFPHSRSDAAMLRNSVGQPSEKSPEKLVHIAPFLGPFELLNSIVERA